MNLIQKILMIMYVNVDQKCIGFIISSDDWKKYLNHIKKLLIKVSTMILVTGGCGYIGSHCAVELLANGNDIIIIDNLSNSSRKTLKLIKKIVNKDFLYFKYDVKNKKHISKIFEQYNINTIFHFAGLKSISRV